MSKYDLKNQTIFNANGTPISKLAIAFDANDGTIFKHGEASLVEAWANSARASYQANNLAEFAAGLTVLTFDKPSPNIIAFLNHALTHTGWIATAWRRIQAACQIVNVPDDQLFAAVLESR